MEKLFSFLINFIDKNYHQKKIFSFLNRLNIQIIFDIGAHKGEFLRSIKKLKKVNKIYSFEPQKKVFDNLNLLNKGNKVECFNVAISENKGTKKLKINKKTSTSTFSKINSNSKWYKIKSLLISGNLKNSFIGNENVKTTTLDYFCNKNKIQKIDLLKIDTEGHEEQVLIGAANMIAKKKIKYILIEFHLSKMYQNYNVKNLENLLNKSNFQLLKKFKFPLLSFEDRIYKLI